MEEKDVTYSYKGCSPYSAADIYCMDLYLPKDVSGNAPEYILKNIQSSYWDEKNHILFLSKAKYGIRFIKKEN